MTLIKKEDILKGIKDAELVYIKPLKGEVPLRPLSRKEWGIIEKIQVEALGTFETTEQTVRGRRQQTVSRDGSQINTKGIIDLVKQTDAELKGKTEALFLSMNNNHSECEQWTREDIQEFKRNAFDEIYRQIEILSGIEPENKRSLKSKIDSFPEN